MRSKSLRFSESNKKIVLAVVLIALVGVMAIIVLRRDSRPSGADVPSVPSYNETVKQIPVEERYPKGGVHYNNGKFDRGLMRFGVVPEQQKAELMITNNSDKNLTLNLVSKPEGVAVPATIEINAGSSKSVVFPGKGTYLYRDTVTDSVLTVELVDDPDYTP